MTGIAIGAWLAVPCSYAAAYYMGLNPIVAVIFGIALALGLTVGAIMEKK